MGYRVAFVGTGSRKNESTDGYAMAYRHAQGYERIDGCELVACADLVRANAEAFAREFDIGDDQVYEDHERMLAEAGPDIISVCVPPKAHAEIVTGSATSGVVDAIHCEKPMAATWKECREMVEVCDRQGVQLTINHQRRFAAPFRKAKTVLDNGRIGELERIEMGGQNLYDYGTHLFDMCGYLTNQAPVEWVLGQVDYHTENLLFGMHNENQALARWKYTTGVDGFASTGEDGMVSCQLRLLGADGIIEIGPEAGPPLRIQSDGSGWQRIDTGGDGIYRAGSSRVTEAANAVASKLPIGSSVTFGEPTYIGRGIRDLVEALETERSPELAASNALDSTELIFACWESARRRERVTLPLEIGDNPLEAMVASGALTPSPTEPPETAQ